MYPDIPGFHRVEVPTLSKGGARDIFYNLCNLGRSSAVDDLIARLDFHPLSISLLAIAVHESDWDESTLLKAWDDGQTGVLKTQYHQRLKDAVEPSFHSPTIRSLGDTARNALLAIASFPSGVEECRLESISPGIGEAVDVLCKFSLVYRESGFVKMLWPFRFYFLESALELAQHVEVIHWDAGNCSASKSCLSFSFHLFYDRGLILLKCPLYTPKALSK
jgi:hypothetical protein